MKRKNLKRKTFVAPIELKADGEEGEFKAVFATLNVEDHHGDVTLTGAFDEKEAIVEPWNHDWTLPAGKGVIKANEEEAWIEGKFFLDTHAGKENYQTVKNLGELAEWSYTFDIVEADFGVNEGEEVRFLRKLDVVGVGPVTRGAGIDTRTVTIKGNNQPDPPEAAEPEEDDSEDETGSEQPGKSSEALMTQINLLEMSVIKHRLEG